MTGIYNLTTPFHKKLMGKDDWFRNDSWDPTIEQAFLAKLAKARSQRDQYLAIQISCLSQTHPEQALRLCTLYDDTRTDTSRDAHIKDSVARAYAALGKISIAIAVYKDIVEQHTGDAADPFNVYLDAPLLIATRGSQNDFGFAWTTIAKAQWNQSTQGISLPIWTFKHHAAQALLRARTNQPEAARDQAAIALHAAGLSHSGLRYHARLGLVGPEHRATVFALRAITTGYPVWVLKLMSRFYRAGSSPALH